MSNLSATNIKELMLKSIDMKEFLTLERLNEDNIGKNVYRELIEATDKKDSLRVDNLIYLIFKYKLFDEIFLELLNRLLAYGWHKQHENIAMLLQKLKSPSSVEVLYETSTRAYKYLEYDEFNALAVKCIWALGDIGTEKARGKLELLLENKNNIIKENAQKQINRINSRTNMIQ